MATPYYVTALLFDGEPRWNSGEPTGTPVNITYSFMTSNPGNPSDPNFIAFTQDQSIFIEQRLAAWSDVANITFTPANNLFSNDGQIRFGMTDLGGQGLSDPPNPGGSTNTWLDRHWSTDFDTTPGSFFWYVTTHEIGHALGLRHPGPYNFGDTEDPDAYSKPNNYLPQTEDNYQYTLMSYNDGENGRVKYTGSDAHASTPLLYDIAAIQYLYGANTTTRTGNDIYSWNPNQAFHQAIWDAGGIDTISAANQTLDAIINLNNGSFSSIGPRADDSTDRATDNLAIAFEVKDGAGNIINLIENATGGSGNDKIYGNSVANVLDGGFGNDEIFGGEGNDTLYGGQGNDYLNGEAGNDILDGGNGDDFLVGWDGSDILYGQEGNDTLWAGNDNDYLYGGEGNDELAGWNGNDYLYGGQGNDYLDGEADNDTLDGGNGNDYLYGGDGNDYLDGGFGNDSLNGGLGYDILYGGDGDDYLNGGLSFAGDTLYGGAGNDTLYGLGSSDILYGGTGDDTYIIDTYTYPNFVENPNEGIDTVQSSVTWTLYNNNLENLILTGSDAINGTGNASDNTITGNSASNSLEGQDGNDNLFGEAGNDTLDGGTENDSLYGGEGDDYLFGGFGNDLLFGDGGIDTMHGDFGDDYLEGGAYDDYLNGGDGNDYIDGGSDNDSLWGGNDNDTLVGGLGNDRLFGEDGDDRLNGYGTTVTNDSQFDILTGGAGSDYFILGGYWGVSYVETGSGYALITDWDASSDWIEVKGCSNQYSFESGNWDNDCTNNDTGIYYVANGIRDLIGVVQNSTLNGFTRFNFV